MSVLRQPLALLLALLVSTPAAAASRLVVQLAEPVVVLVDGAAQTASGTRVTVNHIQPGPHTVALRRMSGEDLASVRIDVPADAQVTVRWSPGQPLSVEGAHAATPAGGAAPAGAPPPTADPGDPDAPRASAPPDPADIGSFDQNEGTYGGQRPPAEGPAGNPGGFNRTVGTVARVGVGAVAPRVAPIVAPAAGGLAHGTASMVRNADAGGASAFRGPTAPRQGRPIPPKAKIGHVELVNPTGYPCAVYVEGFEVARFGPGSVKQVVRLEEGRHVLTFTDLATLQPRYAGLVRITEGARVVVEFGQDAPPSATAQSWAWESRAP